MLVISTEISFNMSLFSLSCLFLLWMIFAGSRCGDTNGEMREINYHTQVSRLYKRQIGRTGTTLTVGDHWTKKMEGVTEETVLKCRFKNMKKNYRDGFRTKLMESPESLNEISNKTLFHELLVFTRQEVWSCSNTKDSPNIGLIRIVNELVSQKEVYKVLYPDGISVTPFPFGKKMLVKIREIKYLHHFTGEVIRYDGKLILLNKPTEADVIPGVKETLLKRGITSDDGTFESLHKSISPQDNPTMLKFGSWSGKEYRTYISNCKKYQGPFPFKARTVIRPYYRKDDAKIPLFSLTESEYLDYVTPIVNEIWICQDQKGAVLYRTVNEFITKKQLGIAITTEEMVELRAIQQPGLASPIRAARVKAIKYYNHLFHAVTYVGRINLKPTVGDVLHYGMGCIFKQTHGQEMREIHYILQKKRIYRSVIGNMGHNIRIGSKVGSVIGEREHIVRCKLQLQADRKYESKFVTELKILVLQGGREHLKSVQNRERAKFWRVVEQEVWMCQKDKPNPYTFLRIVNHLKGTRPIYEIEYYEGIYLQRAVLSRFESGEPSVTVVEVKYIHHHSFEALQYEGKFILEAPSSEDKKTSYHKCFVCDGPRIGGSENEIVFEDGRSPITVLDPNVIEGVDYSNDEIVGWYKGNEHIDAEVDKVGGITHGELDVVDCSPTNVDFKELNPTIQQKFPYYVIELWKEVWNCSNKDFSFYRSYINAVLLKGGLYSCKYGYELVNDGQMQLTKGVRFVKVNDKAAFNYAGMCRMNPSPKYPPLDARSGTVIMFIEDYQTFQSQGGYSDGQEVIYRIDQGDKYYLPINKDGRVSLQFGRRYEKAVGSWTGKVIDVNVVPLEFKNHYRTKVFSTGSRDDMESDLHVVYDKYIRLYYYEVWNCKSKGKEDVLFKRVVNFFLLFPYSEGENVKDVKFYDGVTVTRGNHDYTTVTWEFFEIKYLHPVTLQDVKYIGTLELDENDLMLKNVYEPSDNTRCTMNASIHEVTYQIDYRTIHGKYLKRDGMFLKIGSMYKKVFKGESTMSCEEIIDTNEKHALQHSKIELMIMKESDRNRLEAMDTETFEKTYQHTSELWNCHAKNADGATVRILRVITTLVKKDATLRFSPVLFYDGVTVLGEAGIIKEIKYIDREDNQVMRFDGFVSLCGFPNYEPYRISELIGREIDYRLDQNILMVKTLRSTGNVYIIGRRFDKTFGNKFSNSLCNRIETSEIQNVIKPEVSQIKNFKFYGSYCMNHLKEMFTIEQKAWKCSDEYSNSEFTRVVNRLETNSIIVSTIYHYDGLVAWISKLNGKTIIQETKYIDLNDNKIVKYEGHITYLQTDVQIWKPDIYQELFSEETQALTEEEFKEREKDSNWYKDPKNWTPKTSGPLEPIENTIYSLLSPHTTFIQPSRGINIEVGSKWEKTIGLQRDTFTCMIDNTRYKESDLLTKVVLITELGLIELVEDTFYDYFEIESMEISLCKRVPVKDDYKTSKRSETSDEVEDSQDSEKRIEFDPFYDYVMALRHGHLTSLALGLEKEFLKRLYKLERMFSTYVLSESDKFDRQFGWNFNAIIGIKILERASFLDFPGLEELLKQAMIKWREYLDSNPSVSPKLLNGKKGAIKKTPSFEIATHVSNRQLEDEEFSRLSTLIEFEIAVEVLIMLAPEKQRVMFIELLEHFNKGDLKDVYNIGEAPVDKKMEEFERIKAANSESIRSTLVSHCMLIHNYKSLVAGQSLSQDLELLNKWMTVDGNENLITHDTLNNNPQLKWNLESVIGIEAAISSYYYRSSLTLRDVLEEAVELWKGRRKGGTLPSTPVNRISRQSTERSVEESLKPAIPEIIGEVLKKHGDIHLSEEDITTLESYMELKLSVYLMYPIVPIEEGLLLRYVTRCFVDRPTLYDGIRKVVDESRLDILDIRQRQ